MIDKYLKTTVQNLQKLMDRTPACIVAFLGGALPGTALLHLKQLTIFGMITRLKGSELHKFGVQVLTSARPSLNSWFQQIRGLCLLYKLPHPILLLQEVRTKGRFDKLVKSKVDSLCNMLEWSFEPKHLRLKVHCTVYYMFIFVV